MKTLKIVAVLLFTLKLSSAVAQYDAIQPQGIYSSEFNIDNIPRNITYYMPLNYGKSDTYPLVIMLHDANSSTKELIKNYGNIMHSNADSTGAVIMYPEAFAQHWNSKSGTPFPATDTINDVGFITIMTDFFVQQYHCDPERVYVAGIGNGGEMAGLLLCENPKKYVKAASINANKNSTCSNAGTQNIININQPDKQAINTIFKTFFSASK